MSEDAPLLFACADGIATLTLNRPQAGNAITLPLARALAEAAARCAGDEDIKCVLLTGAGKLFCAGGDLTLFREAGTQLGSLLGELADSLHNALSLFSRMTKPLVVLVNGPAAGAGLSLALCGDIVLATSSSHFTAAYSRLGLTPDGGMTWLLPRLVGLRRAQEIILTNRRVPAEEAVAMGMVTRVVGDGLLMQEGLAVARHLSGPSSHALGMSRHLLQNALDCSFEAQLEKEALAIVAAAKSAGMERASPVKG
ncbi:MAG: enoyl-CoA hydratase/isomerase family protein [Sphingobium sp.]